MIMKFKAYYALVELLTLFIFVKLTDFFKEDGGASSNGTIYCGLLLLRILLVFCLYNKISNSNSTNCGK